MLHRHFFDALPLWPSILYPLVASSILYTMYYYNQFLVQTEGHDSVAVIRNPLLRNLIGVIFVILGPYDFLVHIYCLYVIGWFYLIIIPLQIALTAVFQLCLGIIPLGHILLPLLVVFIHVLFLNYIGLIHSDFLLAINEWPLGSIGALPVDAAA